jgi:hypothetical protein
LRAHNVFKETEWDIDQTSDKKAYGQGTHSVKIAKIDPSNEIGKSPDYGLE